MAKVDVKVIVFPEGYWERCWCWFLLMTPLMHITVIYHVFPTLLRRASNTCTCALQVVLLGQQSVGEFRGVCNGLHCQCLLSILTDDMLGCARR